MIIQIDNLKIELEDGQSLTIKVKDGEIILESKKDSKAWPMDTWRYIPYPYYPTYPDPYYTVTSHSHSKSWEDTFALYNPQTS